MAPRTTSGRRDPPLGVLYENERTRISRVPMGTTTALRKEALGPQAAQRIGHETSILRRLQSIDGVSRLVRDQPGGNAMLLDDIDGRSLDDILVAGRLDVSGLPALALRLATTIAAVHRVGVMHRDVNPTNVVVRHADGAPILIDFDLATTFAEVRPDFTTADDIIGRLPYMAPEQTGRTGHSVDRRADLYSLGATLYELAAGEPPFGHGEPVALIRDLLATPPVPLGGLVPAVSPSFSAIVARLLEKEPGRRYQSAEGLAYDIGRCHERPLEMFLLGDRDFADRLSAPSDLVGRAAEIARLRTALDDATTRGVCGVLVTGAPGVGKSALIAQLRPLVTAREGLFVAAQFDQYRYDDGAGPVMRMVDGVARLLLAEPEAVLDQRRRQIRERLGANVRWLAAAAPPDLATLLDQGGDGGPDKAADPADPADDPAYAPERFRQALINVLGAVASAERPLVVVLDDLQWASRSSLNFVDAILAGTGLHGLLLVGAYREDAVDAAHPLTAMLTRWERLGVAPHRLPLGDLGLADLNALLAEMLRVPVRDAAALASVLAERTRGNLYDLVELVNALRQEDALALCESGWTWDEQTVRQYVGHGDVLELMTPRLDRLPRPTRRSLALMASLGGEVRIRLLAAASGCDDAAVLSALAPAIDDRLVTIDETTQAGDPAHPGIVRFRHERILEAVAHRLDEPGRADLGLTVARRLANTREFRTQAAEQYLRVAGHIRDIDEKRRAGRLMAETAKATRVNNAAGAERLLSAAHALLTASGDLGDPERARLEIAWHGSLYMLGRFDDIDGLYRSVTALAAEPLDLVDATCVQISSLTHRGRLLDATALGLRFMARLGLDVPGPDLAAAVGPRLDALLDWSIEASVSADLDRPEATEVRTIAASKLIGTMMSAAIFSDRLLATWLVTEGHRRWAAYGPSATLAAAMSSAIGPAIALGADYAAGVRIQQHVLAVSAARGYGYGTAYARFSYVMSGCHWFEPVEESIRQSELAIEELTRNGDLQHACYAYLPRISGLLDHASTIDTVVTQIDAALGFTARISDNVAAATYVAYRQLIRALRGENGAPGSFFDADDDEDAHMAGLSNNPMGAGHFHIARGLAAVMFGEPERLGVEAAGAMALVPVLNGHYATAIAHLLASLHLAGCIRAAAHADRGPLLAEFDLHQDWFTARARDAPGNYRHLLRFVQAEKAWALGDFVGAAAAYDAALRDVDDGRRPWHRALIAERNGRLHLEYGMERAGHQFIADARDRFTAWGAGALSLRLTHEFPAIGTGPTVAVDAGTRPSQVYGSIRVDDVDMLAVLTASQSLSSETSLDRVHTAVVGQMRAITGATAVQFLTFDAECADWAIPATTPCETATSVERAAAAGLLPLTAFRYAERTREPLLVTDLTRDDRFARDPYVRELERCSLLAVPILKQGTIRAMLMLENRLAAGAFSAERLGAVMLIAGQLAVSIDNALLYRELEDKVAERTRALRDANDQLAALSVTDSLTGLANRRQFDTAIDESWAGGLTDQRSVGLVLMDIDHFKLFNDLYGHQAGDECLRRVGRALVGATRQPNDTACRYGGEEFAVVVSGADPSMMFAIGDRVRNAVSALGIPHASADVGHVTLSVGVAYCVPSAGSSTALLIKAADEALYRAKSAGRNTVCVAGDIPA